MFKNKTLITCACLIAASALSIYTFGASTLIGGIAAIVATASLGTGFVTASMNSGDTDYSRAASNSISRVKHQFSNTPLRRNISNNFEATSKKDNSKKLNSFRKPTSYGLKF